MRQGQHAGDTSAFGSRSQARLAGELEELGYHVTQSMVSRYEQGLLEAPLTLERMVGWALCCEGLGSLAFRELLVLAGYYLPWTTADLDAFDDLLTKLPTPESDRPGGGARPLAVAHPGHRGQSGSYG